MLGDEAVDSFAGRLARRLDEWASQVQDAGPTRSEGRSRLLEGRTWIDPERLRPDRALTDTIVHGLLQDLQATTGKVPHVLRRVEDALASGDLSTSTLLRSVLVHDDSAIDGIARQAGVPTQVLHFLGGYLARPFLAAASREFDPQILCPEREGPGCPVCGHEAALSFLLPETGARRLWCRYCGNGWFVPRLRCSFCSNADRESLGYFEIEGTLGRRVDFCRRCRRYLKTIDLREVATPEDAALADLEDLTTGELDAAAVEERFCPPRAAGVTFESEPAT